MRTCTSAAPASRSIRTRARWVLPRTMVSSTTTSRLPGDHVPQRVQLEPDAELADGLARLDEGAPDVGVLDQPCPYGIPDARRSRSRAGVPDSGTGMTRSASAGSSCARVRPTSTRTECSRWPEIMVSGRAR